MIWFTSDTHFGHARIVDYCLRPYPSVGAMDEGLIAGWNARVRPWDTVYHLGDFCLGPPETIGYYRARLNGRIVLIKGNHDRSRRQHLEAGFEAVCTYMILEVMSRRIFLSHRPAPQLGDELRRQALFCPLQLHGHVHNGYRQQRTNDWLRVNVGVDLWGYRPVALEELLNPEGGYQATGHEREELP